MKLFITKIIINLIIISKYLIIAQQFEENNNNEEIIKRKIINNLIKEKQQKMDNNIKNLIENNSKILKVEQSNILGEPLQLCPPPCTKLINKCLEPQPMLFPINCPSSQRSLIPPLPQRMFCPPPTVCPPPQPCPAPLTCPRPVPCPLPLPPQRPPPPPMPFPLPFPPQIICPSRANIFPATINAQNDCCCNCDIRSCRVFSSNTKMQKRHFLATFGSRTHSGGNDFPYKIFNNNIEGGDINEVINYNNDNAKCNSELLRKIILENISSNFELSKRKIQASAELAIGEGARVSVICGANEFTFVVHATIFCQAGNLEEENGSCYAFSSF